jgi:hypothetical protein
VVRRGSDMRRAANEEIANLARTIWPTQAAEDEWSFLCECGNPQCHRNVLLTLEAFRLARASNGGEILAAPHASGTLPI